MPLVAPFETSFGIQTERDILLLKATTSEGEGWGECVATEEPTYSSEYIEGAQHVLVHHLLPRLFEHGDLSAEDVADVLRPVHGHQMAKASIEMAILDAQLRARGESFAHFFGAVRDGGRLRRVGWDPRLDPRAPADGGRLSRPGLPAHQAEDQAGLGRRAGAGGEGAVRRRAPAGRRQHGLRRVGRQAPGRARRVRAAADRAAAARGAGARARGAGQGGPDARSASTSRSRPCRRRRTRSSWARAR